MLGDLRIVEIGEGMAIQVAGLMLSELGADVLKVERPGAEIGEHLAGPGAGQDARQVEHPDMGECAGHRLSRRRCTRS